MAFVLPPHTLPRLPLFPKLIPTMAATRRITKEYAELQSDFPPNVTCAPDENNIFHWVRRLSLSLAH